MDYIAASSRIDLQATGVYLAFPTTPVFKPTYRGHKTMVNDQHTKVGITVKSFASRKAEYLRTFNNEVAFFPILSLDVHNLQTVERAILAQMCAQYSRSGPAREWFWTTDRQAMAERVWHTVNNLI